LHERLGFSHQVEFSRLTSRQTLGKVSQNELARIHYRRPRRLVGKPVIRGTRLAVEFVLGLLAQGWPEQEITRNYRLTAEHVRACVAYAQERLNEEKVAW
jgi:uncharacterized protein (DUF433 family)